MNKDALFSLIMLLPLSAYGDFICHDETTFPSVMNIEQVDGNVVAQLGGVSWDEKSQTVAAVQFRDNQWRVAPRRSSNKYSVMSPHFRQCSAKIPLPKMTREEAQRLREWAYTPEEFSQYVTACDESETHIYFGLGFYQGEGTSGVGGIGRLDKRTKTVEIRHPLLLRDSSVTALAFDGQSLWLGTAKEMECTGLVAAHGLLRYKWDSNTIEQESGFPGLVIHDLRVIDGTVWAASDLGISRRVNDILGFVWQHWTFTAGREPHLQREGQHTLYRRLAHTLSNTPHPAGDSPFNYFAISLATIFPRDAVDVLSTMSTVRESSSDTTDNHN